MEITCRGFRLQGIKLEVSRGTALIIMRQICASWRVRAEEMLKMIKSKRSSNQSRRRKNQAEGNISSYPKAAHSAWPAKISSRRDVNFTRGVTVARDRIAHSATILRSKPSRRFASFTLQETATNLTVSSAMICHRSLASSTTLASTVRSYSSAHLATQNSRLTRLLINSSRITLTRSTSTSLQVFKRHLMFTLTTLPCSERWCMSTSLKSWRQATTKKPSKIQKNRTMQTLANTKSPSATWISGIFTTP